MHHHRWAIVVPHNRRLLQRWKGANTNLTWSKATISRSFWWALSDYNTLDLPSLGVLTENIEPILKWKSRFSGPDILRATWNTPLEYHWNTLPPQHAYSFHSLWLMENCTNNTNCLPTSYDCTTIIAHCCIDFQADSVERQHQVSLQCNKIIWSHISIPVINCFKPYCTLLTTGASFGQIM